MNDFWISDAEGRVLGPISFEVLKDLIGAGRIPQISRASNDGQNWAPLENFPAIRQLMSLAAVQPTEDDGQVQKVRDYLQNIRRLPIHEIFRVPAAASLDEHRVAFFSLVKRFYPDRLPPNALPALRAACEEVFLFLAGQMVQLEAAEKARTASAPPIFDRAPDKDRNGSGGGFGSGGGSRGPMNGGGGRQAVSLFEDEIPASAPPPAPVLVTPPPRAEPAPTYRPEEFLGLERRPDGHLEARIQINANNVGMFTAHPVVNLSTGGMFIPADRVVPLGTHLELCLCFEGSVEIQTRCKVIWENMGADPRHPTGFGVRLLALNSENRSYIQEFINRSAVPR